MSRIISKALTAGQIKSRLEAFPAESMKYPVEVLIRRTDNGIDYEHLHWKDYEITELYLQGRLMNTVGILIRKVDEQVEYHE